MRVEMRVFSGRPNPCWVLEGNDLPDFPTALYKLPHHGGTFDVPERLGYSGLVVSNEDASAAWTEIIVFHELVMVRLKKRTDYLIDDDRTVENMLLEAARGHVKDAVIERIRAERASGGMTDEQVTESWEAHLRHRSGE